MNHKPCNCTFCSQFYFKRQENYKFNKQNKLTNVENKINTENKTVTLSDFENIRILKSLNCDTDEISKQTNISYSIVESIIKIISPKS